MAIVRPLRFMTPGQLLALAVVVLGTSDAVASTVVARLDGNNPNAPVTITRTLRDPYLSGTGFDVRQVSPSRFTMTRTGGTFSGTLVGTAPQFFGYCVEPLEFITPGASSTFNLTNLENGTNNIGGMGVTKANYIRELFYQQLPVLSAVISDAKASALEVAIWEIVRENPANSFNVASGDASFSSSNAAGSSVIALAQSYLSALTGNGPRLTDLYVLQLNGTQDVLVQMVPEPSTCAAMAMGLGGLGLAIVRRKRSR